jgi:predicted enzyme related to lactoylglutathione lyase
VPRARKPLFRGVDCVRVPVPDLDAGLAFYRDELGHALRWRSDTAAGLRLGKGRGETELVIHVESDRAETDLLVDDVPRAIARLVRAGGTLVAGPFEIPVGRVAVAADPWGNPLVVLDLSKGLLRTDRRGRVTGVRKARRRNT